MQPKSKRITLLTGGVKTRRKLKGVKTEVSDKKTKALDADEYYIKKISGKPLKIKIKKR